MKPRYRDLPLNFWLLVTSVFFMRVGQFMILPFMAIIMTQKFHSSPVMVGVVVGVGPLMYALSSINCGHLSDRFGPKVVMIGALLIGGVACLGLYAFNYVWVYLVLNAALGVFRSAFNAASRAYIYMVVEESQRLLAYGINYMGINTGLAFGLLIGTLFAAHQSTLLFLYIALVYVVLSVAIGFILPNKKSAVNKNKLVTFKNTLQIIIGDHKLLWLVSGCIVIWLGYVQLDSTLPIHLVRTFPHGAIMYAEILVVNAILASTLQPIFSKLLANVHFMKQIVLAVALFVCGYCCYIFFNSLLWFMIGMGFVTLAELIVLPLFDVWIGHLADPERPGAYYATGNFIMFGNALGPVLGGWVYELYGIHIVYLGCIVLSILAIALFQQALPTKKPQLLAES
jgi:MFS family permease